MILASISLLFIDLPIVSIVTCSSIVLTQCKFRLRPGYRTLIVPISSYVPANCARDIRVYIDRFAPVTDIRVDIDTSFVVHILFLAQPGDGKNSGAGQHNRATIVGVDNQFNWIFGST